MLKFIFLLFSVFWLFWSNGKRKGWLTPSSWIYFIYVLCMICAIPSLNIMGYKEPFMDKYWGPTILYIALLFLYIYPFKVFDENKSDKMVLPSKQILDLFSTFIIILSFFSLIFFIPSVNLIFAMSDLGQARNDLYGGELYIEVGLSNTIATVSASLYVFAIILFFIYLVLGNSKKRCILLLVSSLSEVIHVLAYVGRDGVVFWIFSFVFAFLTFRPYLDDIQIKKIKKYGIIGGALLMIPFLLISISRFSDSSAYDSTSSSLFGYMGMGPINGILYLGLDNPPCYYGIDFPLYFEITHTKPPVVISFNSIGDWKSWNFSTFVAAFYSDFGLWGMIFVGLVLFILFVSLVCKRKTLHFSSLIIYTLYFQVFSQGVFYFRHYTRGGNLFIVLCFIMYIAFNALEGSSKTVIVKK